MGINMGTKLRRNLLTIKLSALDRPWANEL